MFFNLEAGQAIDADCPQRNVPVRLGRLWRSGLVCRAALPSLNGQQWLSFTPPGERTSCDGCPIQEASLAFLRNGVQSPTETEEWLQKMERFAKRPPTMTVWDKGSGGGGE